MRGWRQVNRRLHTGHSLFDRRPPLALRPVAQVVVAQRQQIQRDERRRRLRGEHRDARLGRVDAQQQRLKVEAVVVGDDDLAIHDAAWRQSP